MSDVLKNLRPTTWYKTLMIVSAPAFLIVLATQRNALTMIFFGSFLIGLGEWRNHPKKEIQFRPVGGGQLAKVTDVPRKANWFGILLQTIGSVLVIAGCYWALGFPLLQSK